MATLKEYVSAKLTPFRYALSEQEMDIAFIEAGVENSELTAETLNNGKLVLWMLIPGLLALPDVSEGDFSIKYNRTGLTALKDQIGEELELVPRETDPTIVQDKSDLW